MNGPILLIGAGRMGGALLAGWIKAGIAPLAVVEPSPSPYLRRQARAGTVVLHDSAAEIRGPARACVVALKPQILKREAADLKVVAQNGALMISIAAGVTIKALAKSLGLEARIVRAMPNTPGAIGRGISALYAQPKIGPANRRLAESLLGALGETLWVRRESQIDAVTAVSGSGPAYVFLLAEVLENAAVAEGLPVKVARRLARATVAGAGAMLDVDKREASELRRDVTSPGGTTEAALDVLLAKDGLRALIGRAVHAAQRRAEELSR